MTTVVFGAGNIGRAFIGRLFASDNNRVIFIDVRADIVAEINSRGEYPIIIKDTGVPDRKIVVRNVSAILSNDQPTVQTALVKADYVVTCVGMRALTSIASALSDGILERWKLTGKPLNIILAENIHDGVSYLRGLLLERLPSEFPLCDMVGISAASVGKMVPVMNAEGIKSEPLAVNSEGFNTLVVDGRAFIGSPPPISDIHAVDDIAAFMDRKLFLHNLGHAAVAYFGHITAPGVYYIAEAISLPSVASSVRATMYCACEILLRSHPSAFNRESLEDHAEDLLRRFANIGLRDTLHRVGRDLRRKLSRDDRVLGAILLGEAVGVDWTPIIKVFFAALHFDAPGESGLPDKEDLDFISKAHELSTEDVLVHLCGMNPNFDSLYISKVATLAHRFR